MALIKEWRLKKKEDFEMLARSGRRETTPLLKIWWLTGEGLAAVRVSKKISKKAAIRNRIRRVMWERLREQRPVWADKKMVIIIREPVDRQKEKLLTEEWEQIANRWGGGKE